MPYYLGLDAGGTKTFCLVGDETGRVLGFGRAGAGNYEVRGVEAAAIENRRAVEQALGAASLRLEDVRSVGMGIAGADLPEDYVMLDREIFTPLFGAIPRVFRNDSMAGLRGGLREPYGIVIACGTGCVCAGVNRDGRDARVGGLGEEFGDKVSGSSIGVEGIQAVWRARDGILPPTLLTALFVERSGCADVEELFHKLYRGELSYADLQPMAKIVFDAARLGDAAACDILEWGGRYLGQMVNACARKLGMSEDLFKVAMAGSVFKGDSPVLADALRTVVHRECPKAEAVMPAFEPVVGALLMGMELDGAVSDTVYERLAGELAEAERRFDVQLKAG
ncbi:MAG TPA: BadF/BadG/BcrA/BcrD ATPase family protein [Candidatus Hydrogenedentes bacterium]|nr:BadF/BadG/BcrA/BcrD ATPase family protein [Candidatus Hydrogenedentota bacterium]HNT89317.1 BadF/BadG/BcrA/BcrD ATPase family protein [Candidatus Hydrogenedentota bacterium]